MTRIVAINIRTVFVLGVLLALSHRADAAGPGQQAVTAAAENGQFSFIMFYRGNDSATKSMYGTLKSTLESRDDAVIVPVRIDDSAEKALIDRFDATRMPMPAVAVLAPNDAVCIVYPQRVTPEQLTVAIVSPAQAECLKSLQDKKITILCAQPDGSAEIPAGVRQFQADKLFQERTQVVTVQAKDPNESRFLRQLRVPTDRPTSVVAFMAPPGVMIGVFGENITHRELAEKLAAAGQCCDDENCKYHKSHGAKKK
ncbi:hypothetical protein [Thalassoroseus pseudoceratinae]|uniref:hypothetical protein n=1 Tax=Thalassoroseus pseudoceratinae TaxID=2713176 RepID=UPI001422BEE3|nr:hypothetical protein [Thalassoroseus pseudoceratinae]